MDGCLGAVVHADDLEGKWAIGHSQRADRYNRRSLPQGQDETFVLCPTSNPKGPVSDFAAALSPPRSKVHGGRRDFGGTCRFLCSSGRRYVNRRVEAVAPPRGRSGKCCPRRCRPLPKILEKGTPQLVGKRWFLTLPMTEAIPAADLPIYLREVAAQWRFRAQRDEWQ